jgi:streptogramin lyase
MKRLLSLTLIAAVSVGCGGSPSQTGQSGVALLPSQGVRPGVVQTGSQPHHWLSFREPSAHNGPFAIARGPDGNLWFTTRGGVGAIGMIDYSGTINEFTLQGNSSPWDITTGHDGKLWFADPGTGNVGSITTSGVVALYRAPVGGAITAGPQGSVWFTGGNGIGKVTPSGKITYFALPHPASEITHGSDGNLWFTIATGSVSKVGSMTPTGTVVEYNTPSNVGGPVSIAPGSDGNLWVLAQGTPGAILKVTTTGSMTEFTLPGDVNGSYNRIVPGVGNTLWYTRNSGTPVDAQFIGQITTTGTVTEHKYPTNDPFDSYLGGIVRGADGNLWFTQTPQDNGSINVYVRLVLFVTPSSVNFSGIGQTKNVSVSESDYAGSWTAATSNPAIATVAQGSPSNVFVITSTGSGTATITVSDSKHNYFNVVVSVP